MEQNRKRKAARPPVVLDPDAIITLAWAGEALGLRRTTLRREARAGRLRVAELGRCYFTTGAWLLEWLKGREGKRAPRRTGRRKRLDEAA